MANARRAGRVRRGPLHAPRRNVSCAPLLALVLAVGGGQVARASPTFPYSRQCARADNGAAAFFDTAGLECVPCGPNEVAAPSGLACECQPGYARSAQGDENALTFTKCTPCVTQGLAVSEDGRHCIACDATTAVVDAQTGKCRCKSDAPTSVLSETDETGAFHAQGTRCVTCASDAYVAGGKCVRCPYPRVFSPSLGKCLCAPSSGTTDNFPSSIASGTMCVEGADTLGEVAKELRVALNNPFRHTFTGVLSTMGGRGKPSTVVVDNSAALVNFLPNATTLCYEAGDRRACNSLANLCVLSMFQRESNACQLYEALVTERARQQYWAEAIKPKVGWSLTLPWLYYEDGPRDVLVGNDIATPVTFAPKEGKNHEMKFVLGAYALDGTWLGFNNATLPLLQLCGSLTADAAAYTRFGASYRNSCNIKVGDIFAKFAETLANARLESRERRYQPVFYDLYFQDGTESDGTPRYFAVPLIVENYEDRSNRRVNTEDLMNDGVLTRRFFLFDLSSGIPETNPQSAASATAQAAKVPRDVYFTFLSHFTLDVELKSSPKDGINPPRATLRYTTVHAENAAASSSAAAIAAEGFSPPVTLTSASAAFKVDSAFEARYKGPTSGFDSTFENVIIVVGVVTAFAWLFRMNHYIRRRLDPNIDLDFLARALVELCFVGGTLLSITLCFVAWYWFLFYKLQDSVYTLIPRDAQLENFYISISVAVTALAFSTIAVVLYQSNYDYFFIDWERPKYHFEPTLSTGAGQYTASPVSAWRSLFVINQWNDISTWRVTTVPFTYIFSLLFISALNANGLANMTPDEGELSKSYHTVESLVLRFAVSTLVVSATVLAEYLFKELLYDRYIQGHPLDDFIDVLTLSNISILILFDKHAGYYLHGRSLMQSSDTTLSEISNSLRMESGNSMSTRGFITDASQSDPRMPENQEFEIFVPRDLRKSYDTKLLDQIEDKARADANRSSGITLGGAFVAPTLPEEKLLKAQADISTVFKEFLHKVETDHENHVKEKQSILSMFSSDVGVDGNTAIFYHDFIRLWSSSIFFGCELRLALFEMMVFATVHAVSGQAAAAAVTTILIDYVLCWLRKELGTNNISRKSLVDSRFLM